MEAPLPAIQPVPKFLNEERKIIKRPLKSLKSFPDSGTCSVDGCAKPVQKKHWMDHLRTYHPELIGKRQYASDDSASDSPDKNTKQPKPNLDIHDQNKIKVFEEDEPCCSYKPVKPKNNIEGQFSFEDAPSCSSSNKPVNPKNIVEGLSSFVSQECSTSDTQPTVIYQPSQNVVEEEQIGANLGVETNSSSQKKIFKDCSHLLLNVVLIVRKLLFSKNLKMSRRR
uniref:Uncharacterized protein n=1 Tax=Meloidogyne enterolobii TaxID=390850 RepID=A0A6V7XRN0_MELEN|nr:unnamed protein product [Meloidogyne enterolobii]